MKSRDNQINNLLKQIFLKFIEKVLIVTIVFPTLAYIFMQIKYRLDFQWLYNFSPRVYYFCKSLSTLDVVIMITILWGIVILFLLYKLLKKVFFYIAALSSASDELMNKDIEYIELPSELVDIQNKMNFLKTKTVKSERLAKENEQKKDELIIYLAHDIKTPLTSMIGYLSLLDEIDDMPKKQRKKYISVALDKSYRLEELTNELFGIARFNSEKIILEKEELSLNLMMEQIIDDFYPILNERNKEIKLNTEAEIKIFADPDKLSRVFTNLIKNAIYYSKEDSDITINAKHQNSNIIIEIKNEGRQIPKEKLEKLFEKFYRLDSSRTTKTGGSGLGLAIAKNIIELHGGSIFAESDELETTFYVKLPIQ